jgi:hypothetical protein
MASSSRKRPADRTWETCEVSKSSKLSDTDFVATASENRNKQVMDSYSISQRQNLADMAPHSQRDIGLDVFDTLFKPEAMSTGASESLQTDAILSARNQYRQR